jgi:hypothetical protein
MSVRHRAHVGMGRLVLRIRVVALLVSGSGAVERGPSAARRSGGACLPMRSLVWLWVGIVWLLSMHLHRDNWCICRAILLVGLVFVLG